MSKPETKAVLGRVFTKGFGYWLLRTPHGRVRLYDKPTGALAEFLPGETGEIVFAIKGGKSEADAILALQATLRKMAELEVSGG